MKRSLNYKLSLAFIAIAITTALVAVAFMALTSRNRFNNYLTESASDSTANILAKWYAQTGSWDAVERLGLFNPAGAGMPQNLGQGQGPGQGQGLGGGRGPGSQNGSAGSPVAPEGFPAEGLIHIPGEGRRAFTLADPTGIVLSSANPELQPGRQLSNQEMDLATPILVEGQTVGLLLTSTRSSFYNLVEQRFIHNIGVSLLIAILISVVVAGLTGLIFSRSLTKPLDALTQAVKRLAAGEAPTPLEVYAKDEIGELTEAFNQMSYDLEKSNQLRRQMTADVAHDLRTPLTVIGGYVEAIRDGDLEPNEERMRLIHGEIGHLTKLVGDLRTLSQADTGELQLNFGEVIVADLLNQAAKLFKLQAEKQKINLVVAGGQRAAVVNGDETRLLQVLENLLSNALRHTPAEGTVALGSQVQDGKVRVWVRDTGSGIPQEELGLVFERFHRGDRSRHTDDNQSGLGLAISKAIIEAHKGRIWAESEPGEGTRMWLELPLLAK